jgi:hypothetical protein
MCSKSCNRIIKIKNSQKRLKQRKQDIPELNETQNQVAFEIKE